MDVTPKIDRRQFNRGRPPVAAPMVQFAMRLPPDMLAKLELLGGAAWLRARIAKARIK